jgi:hypothetical protein
VKWFCNGNFWGKWLCANIYWHSILFLVKHFHLWCTCRGFYKGHKNHIQIITFAKDVKFIVYGKKRTEEIIPLRLDENFSNYNYDLHQLGETSLLNLGISCARDFMLDYIHLVCLIGVVNRRLCFLKQGEPCLNRFLYFQKKLNCRLRKIRIC